MSVVDDVVSAAKVYDRPAAEAAAEKLGEAVRTKNVDAAPALKALRNNTWFDLLIVAGDRVMDAGQTSPAVRKLYAQALIDTGAVAAAIPFLDQLADETRGKDAYEHDEARGLLGRAWKQAYVAGDMGRVAGRPLLERAARAYFAPYTDNPKNYWPGINAVACLARAERDGHALASDLPSWRVLAHDIRESIRVDTAQDAAKAWDYASAAEACVALGEWDEALIWMQRYVTHSETNVFAVAGTLRQFREVWQLADDDDGGGAALMILLEAEAMKPRGQDAGGQALRAPDPAALAQLQKASGQLQAVLGKEGYRPIGWLETGMLRSRAVGRVTSKLRPGAGTGFLVRGCDLDTSLGDDQFFVTNHHVISDDHPMAFRPPEVLISFEKLGGRPYTVKEFLFTSPVEELDATIVKLDRPVKRVDPFPLCTAIPPLGDTARVYVIGHPLGGQLALSMNDNLLIDYKNPKLHYRAPTDPGSSGSPVFDPLWNLLGLHHAGDTQMRKLHGTGRYAANEGLYIRAVAAAFIASQKKKRSTSTRGKARSTRRGR